MRVWASFVSIAIGSVVTLLFFLTALGAPYDLRTVAGIQGFQGSAGARELLQKNGFAVSDPEFRQLFEAYIRSPKTKEGSETNWSPEYLPSFITPDSAWDTYHILLEEGVKQLEEVQAKRLLELSRGVWAAAGKQSEPELVLYASVGVALQDDSYRQRLGGDARRIADELEKGTGSVSVPLGFSLAGPQFRAQSFYAQSPELSAYFAARQWYASVVFRLSNPHETRLAVALADLVNRDPALLRLWRQLTAPYDEFLARPEDGSVLEYLAAVHSVTGTNPPCATLTGQQMAAVSQALRGRLPPPGINDQLLGQREYLKFAEVTRGFRLLPPRRLPCAICFQNTIDPRIPNRMYPSGLDFMAASPVLRSPAAVRAVQNQFGRETSAQILKADCGPMPDSLHGQAMRLLALLQKPVPAAAPACMRNDAWGDLQLWTQLGAWAQQRHTWALHTKLNVMYLGEISPPRGLVAPYPDFFTGLANLSRHTAEAFTRANQEQKFDVRSAAADLDRLLKLSEKLSGIRDEQEAERLAAELGQLNEFESRYVKQHRAELLSAGPSHAEERMHRQLAVLAGRGADRGQTTEAETATLRLFYDCRQNMARKLDEFAPVCDRLAALAAKSLNGQALTEDDAKWIENYGVTLAGFHFYDGNSYEVPRDDFPIVTRVYSNPLTGSMMYAGLARPQALYVIIPKGGSLQLYRGAVLTYREFVQPNSRLLDDASWRDMVSHGQTPPAPPFTRSFRAETGARELLDRLRTSAAADHPDADEIDDILIQIQSRATDEDLPRLLAMLAHPPSLFGGPDIADSLAETISRLSWPARQTEIIGLMSGRDALPANEAAWILINRSAAVDVSQLAAGFGHQSPEARRRSCAVAGRLPQLSNPARKMLLRALADPVPGVRWQAAEAIGQAGWLDADSEAALLARLKDGNQYVAAAAVSSLGRLRATNAAPALFAELNRQLASPETPMESLERQAHDVSSELHNSQGHAGEIFPVDLRLFISAEANANAKSHANLRLPPPPFAVPSVNYNLARALIEALGDLQYDPATAEFFKLRGTEYEPEADAALGRLAPARLADQLLATIEDRQVDSYLREQAMVAFSRLSVTNRVRELIPLLDDTTPIVYSRPPRPGMEWHVCDRAALTIAAMLHWSEEGPIVYYSADKRAQLIARAREWANQPK